MSKVHPFVKLGLAVAAGFLVAGCGETTATQPTPMRALGLVPTPASVAHDITIAPFSKTATFTIYPNQNTYVVIGTNVVNIPAGVVCNPLTSGYGPAYWSQPCSPITSPITVTASADRANGHPIVDFDQHLRFQPNGAPVTLFMYDTAAGSASKILWCPTATPGLAATALLGCVDESSSSLFSSFGAKATFDGSTRLIFRRILHFSGYNVTAGDDSTNGSGLGQQ